MLPRQDAALKARRTRAIRLWKDFINYIVLCNIVLRAGWNLKCRLQKNISCAFLMYLTNRISTTKNIAVRPRYK